MITEPFRACCWPICTTPVDVPHLFCEAHVGLVQPATLLTLRTALSTGDLATWRRTIRELEA